MSFKIAKYEKILEFFKTKLKIQCQQITSQSINILT